MPKPETFVDQLAAASTEAKEVLRDIRFERAQLEKERKALDKAFTDAKANVETWVVDTINTAVSEGLAEMGKETKAAMDRSVDKVGREFDKLCNLLLRGVERPGMKGDDGFDIGEAIRRKVEWKPEGS